MQPPVTGVSTINADNLLATNVGYYYVTVCARVEPDPTLHASPAAAPVPGQAGSGCSRALFGQPLAALCGEAGTLPRPIQELLDILHQRGPSTEGIFRRAAGATELRNLKEALDRGADVDLPSQPEILLAAVLKDFLRSIPGKLLDVDLYQDWMRAMERPSQQARVEELRV
ncbi:T-cell activation Rho GTPase-activating protein-like [Athene noctua]|uniref:T-cell activation Rho GTPase-activating protein-like n=1 Tax=Athene noctua TaxID=126797 RepID=UPI003EBBDE6D